MAAYLHEGGTYIPTCGFCVNHHIVLPGRLGQFYILVAPCGALWLLQLTFGLLWFFVADCGFTPHSCGYLSPSTLTLPLNYIAVSWDLKYVQKTFCHSPPGCLASELLGRV